MRLRRCVGCAAVGKVQRSACSCARVLRRQLGDFLRGHIRCLAAGQLPVASSLASTSARRCATDSRVDHAPRGARHTRRCSAPRRLLVLHADGLGQQQEHAARPTHVIASRSLNGGRSPPRPSGMHQLLQWRLLSTALLSVALTLQQLKKRRHTAPFIVSPAWRRTCAAAQQPADRSSWQGQRRRSAAAAAARRSTSGQLTAPSTCNCTRAAKAQHARAQHTPNPLSWLGVAEADMCACTSLLELHPARRHPARPLLHGQQRGGPFCMRQVNAQPMVPS